jgi:Putative abortive phage resistance protein AbiGi, antitoxin
MPEIRETLSSNSIFHFTDSAENLLAILKNGVSPRYCLENFSMFNFGAEEEKLELAVPMVAFCDIPLSKVKYHLSFYGNYGIAFSKDWGVQQGISPILYIDPKSETTKSIQDAVYYFVNNIEDYSKADNLKATFSNTTYQKLLRLIRFTKPYQGEFWRKGKYLEETIRFYDEREWRYVPDLRLGENELLPWIKKEDFLKDINRSALNTRLGESYSLRFKPDDVRYIIIEKDIDIIDIVEYIEKNLENQYNKKDIKKLISRVLTKEQIEEDF